MFATNVKECLELIEKENDRNKTYIKYLQEENKKLKDEHYKDEKVQEMQEKLAKMEKEWRRGFPITEQEEKSIEEWVKNHEAKVHGLTTDKMRLAAQGAAGGRYTYIFLPTSLGTSGVIKCSCGAEFEFQKIGW